jgi:hypothetical protein
MVSEWQFQLAHKNDISQPLAGKDLPPPQKIRMEMVS